MTTRFSALAGSLVFGSPKIELKQANENPKINWIKLSRIATHANIAIKLTHQNNTSKSKSGKFEKATWIVFLHVLKNMITYVACQ